MVKWSEMFFLLLVNLILGNSNCQQFDTRHVWAFDCFVALFVFYIVHLSVFFCCTSVCFSVRLSLVALFFCVYLYMSALVSSKLHHLFSVWFSVWTVCTGRWWWYSSRHSSQPSQGKEANESEGFGWTDYGWRSLLCMCVVMLLLSGGEGISGQVYMVFI